MKLSAIFERILGMNNPETSSKSLVKLVLSLALILSAFNISYAQNPFIPKYDAVKRSERCFTVTWEAKNQFGAVWWADKVDFARDTSFNFVVYMGDLDGNGADGLAFVMHQDPRDTVTDPSRNVTIGGAGTWNLEAATGDDGGGLGFAMHQSRVTQNTIPGPFPGNDPENHKIQPSVAVEMDTWNNRDVPDGNSGTDANGIPQVISPFYGWDHTAVIYNGDLYGGQQVITDASGNTGRILPLKPSYAFGSANNPDGSPFHNIEDDRCYLFQVRWEVNPDGTQNLQLWADVYNGTTNTDGLQMIMNHTDDMINKVFGGNSVLRFGFTGSTGGAINEQTVCLLGENLKPFAQDDYASIPMNSTAIVDVESNDNDPDGDQLHVPIIVDPAKYGTATIFDSLDINYLRYTPNTNYVGLDTISYVTCDVNSTKCYAKCDTANVFIDVGCVPFDISVNALSPNTLCNDTLPQNGSAQASVVTGNQFGILWSENFDGLANGTTSTSKWNMDLSNANFDQSRDHAEVRSNRISISDIGDHGAGYYVTWSSEVIDISAVSDVTVTLDLEGSGNMESAPNKDFINAYYKLDGGVEMPLANGTHTGGSFTAKASVAGLNGSTLQIIVRATNSANNEYYYLDNVTVQAVGAGTANVSYNWYKGSITTGTPDFIGQIYNGMNSGLYTVVATDLNTGCKSNPQTVTIDSAISRPAGGYIIQAAPFTNCQLPYDGQLEAGVFNGTDSTYIGYMFQWYIQEDPTNIIQTGYIASGLRAREYTVQIIDLSTGCDTTLSEVVPNAVALPLVTAAKVADVISCTNPNSGVAAANVGGTTSGYRFEWFTGPAIGAGPPDFVGDTVNTFPTGTFTVQAIDSLTFCPSDPVSVTINDLTSIPMLQVSVDANQISCDTLAPTGQLSGTVDVGGTPTTTGYTFNWYKGFSDIIPARPGYSGGPVADSLSAGNYRLVVVEDGTNCTSFVDTLVQDMTVTPPSITLSTSDVTFCSSPNGTITVNVSGNVSDYIYDLYKGNGVIADSLMTTQNSNVFQNLNVGNYTVVARDVVTKCATNSVTAKINDATTFPSAIINVQNQSSCDPANPNGQLTASMGFGAISDYNYEWHKDSLNGQLIPPASVGGEFVTNLDTGNYVLKLSNKISGCTSLYYPNVNLGIVLPVESVTSSPSTNCGSAANGQLIATVDGGKTEADGYTFIWESLVINDTLTDKTSTVNGVVPGDYLLTVINDATKCASNPAPINVGDNTIIPIPTLNVADNSSCDVTNPNGEVQVTGINNEPNPISDYNFTWYDGNSSGTQLVSPAVSFPLDPDSSRISGLSSGTVALVIKNSITTCSNEILSIINDINVKPVIDGVTATDATDCSDAYMSGAVVTGMNGTGGIPAGYTFAWVNSDGGPAISGNGSAISDQNTSDEILPPGNYKVVAMNTFNCPSDSLDFIIKDLSVPPAFNINDTPNSSCAWDPSNTSTYANGTLTVNYSGPNTITDYQWERETPAGSGNWVTFGGNTSGVTNLHELDNYRVMVTDDHKCSATNFASVSKVTDPNPFIEFVSVNDLTNCASPDGALEAKVSIGTPPPAGFNYEYILTGPVSGSQLDNGIFQNLSNGNYQVDVINTYTQCQSNSIDTAINIFTDLQFTVVPTAPANCSGALGQIAISGKSNSGLNQPPGTGPGFNYDWYVGSSKTTSVNPADISNPDSWSSTASNLQPNNYTIAITDLSTSCNLDTTIFLPSNSVPVFLNASIANSTQCTPGNGQVDLTIDPTTFGIITPPATYATYADYEYILFKGNSIDASWSAPGSGEVAYLAAGAVPAAGPVNFSGLEPGTYTVVAKEATFGNGCFSEPKTFTINLNYTFGPLDPTVLIPDNTCNTPTGNGQLGENNNAFYTTGSKYLYTWYRGTDTSVAANIVGGPTSATKTTQDTLRAGMYSLKVEITGATPTTGLGCMTTGVVNLNKQIDVLNIVSAPKNDKTICSYGNGDIQIADISENGTALGGTAGYGNLMLFDANYVDVGTANAGDGSATPWDSLDIGDYYVTAQNLTTLCNTNPYKVTINDVSQNPTITASMVNPDYSCNGVTPTGVLEATANGSQLTTDYNFEWKDALGNLVSDAPSTFRASGLTANNGQETYSITVTDISMDMVNDGCSSSRDFSLIYQPTTVSVLNSAVTSVNQDNCTPNGQIQITSIQEDDGSSTTTYAAPFTSPPKAFEFNAELLDANLNALNAEFVFNKTTGFFEAINASNRTDSIPAGTYYVRASNSTNGCSSGPLTQVIIKDISKDPIISAVLDSPDYACLGGTPTGQLTPSVIGGSDGDIVQTNFAITWTVKSTGANAPGGIVATNLWSDVYTLTVVDATGKDAGCQTTRDFTVPAARHNIQLFASATDQTICLPDGTIQIDSVIFDGANVTNPHLSWTGSLLDNMTKPVMPAPTNSGFASNADPYTNIMEGSYYVLAQDNVLKCFSSPVPVKVGNTSTVPLINIAVSSPQYSLNPNPASWTGGLQATVTEANGIPDVIGYDMAWYLGSDTTTVPIALIDNISMKDDSTYAFTATSKTTGCTTVYYADLPYVYLEPTFNTSIKAKTICSPLDGAIEVTNIALDGNPDMLSDYTFEFYKDSYSPGDAPVQIVAGNDIKTAYENINSGSYYIIAKENWWMVESYPVKVEVTDSTTNPIILFDATNYQAMTSCDPNVYANGSLTVNITEDFTNPYIKPPYTYNFKWYNGDNSDPSNIIQDSTQSTISGLPAGDFTVLVTNAGNNCASEKTFTIEDKSVIPDVVPTMTPVTNCPVEIANGIVTAQVVNSNEIFEYHWYNGDTPGATPDFVGKTWYGKTIGDYTVVAVDRTFGTCISEPAIINVEDATVNPDILLSEIHPITNCDPQRPNAVVSASANGGVSGYTFEWFENGNLYYTGPVASDLGNAIYQIVVTNNVTQCSSTKDVIPSVIFDEVPAPDVDILSDLTSCISPDGKTTASVQGNTKDYIFRYYKKQNNEIVSNEIVDNVISDLDTSAYYVTAESRVTGCISKPTEFVIANETYFPQIDIIADPSNCQDPSGAANVIISDMTREFKVTWHGDNGFEAQEKELVYIPVGKYTVEVEGTDGCVTTAEAEVKGDIIIYNGVSANDDGLNDYFQVVCLEYFPNNNVKIYNRAGLLVYEQHAYDMNDPSKRFEGFSNKGASIIGTELPIGTYFYVVDKNDGSKPKVGYLELNR